MPKRRSQSCFAIGFQIVDVFLQTIEKNEIVAAPCILVNCSSIIYFETA